MAALEIEDWQARLGRRADNFAGVVREQQRKGPVDVESMPGVVRIQGRAARVKVSAAPVRMRVEKLTAQPLQIDGR